MEAVRAKGLGTKTRKALEGTSLSPEGTRGYPSHLVRGPCALWGLSPKGLQAF